MVNVKPLRKFAENDMQDLLAHKENPDEWYVLIGSFCGDYNVQAADKPADYEEHQQHLPPEDRDSQENVDGYFQMGTSGWTENAFDDTSDLVSDYIGSRGRGKVDTCLLHTIIVHESMLSDEALEVANGEDPDPERPTVEDYAETEADD